MASTMSRYLFFDNASTTRCHSRAVELLKRYADEDFGNPSSSHAMGQRAARAIREARLFFAQTFNVDPEQVIFTGSGSEADNLAVYGIAMQALVKKHPTPPRVIASAIEHPAVRKTVQSLSPLGIDAQLAPVNTQAQIDREKLLELVNEATALVSVHRVNNIVGSLLPVEDLARECKQKNPHLVFHTDAVQAFGKVEVPKSPSPVDLLSISAHKIAGPKGIGALIVLNKKLLQGGIRPILWGGEQENGLRSGTQSAGLIAAFHAAAEETLKTREANHAHYLKLRDRLHARLLERKLIYDSRHDSRGGDSSAPLVWNSPADAVPYIVSLSVPGFPSGPLAKLLEERNCLVSTGSACSSQKMEPDPVLTAMGLPQPVRSSSIRVSFSCENTLEDVDTLTRALADSISLMQQLLGGKPRK